MTARKPSVARAKRRAFIRAGTCASCGHAIVRSADGLCRRCGPIEREARLVEAARETEDRTATQFFRYWLVCRKKESSDIGRLARVLLADKVLWSLAGLDALAAATLPGTVDVKVLEAAWDESESERRFTSQKPHQVT